MLFKTDNENYEIIIIKKNNKNTYIRVKEDLKIYITTNKFARDKDIEKLIIANYDSIKDCLEKMKRKKHVSSIYGHMLCEKQKKLMAHKAKPEIREQHLWVY